MAKNNNKARVWVNVDGKPAFNSCLLRAPVQTRYNDITWYRRKGEI
jgi:hypothetical protein